MISVPNSLGEMLILSKMFHFEVASHLNLNSVSSPYPVMNVGNNLFIIYYLAYVDNFRWAFKENTDLKFQ